MSLLAIPFAIPFPGLDPVAFALGPISVKWYGLAYMAGLLLGWLYIRRLLTTPRIWSKDTPPFGIERVDDLLLYMTLGVILGGRLGFVLFYEPGYYFSHPLDIPAVWKGGMAFHGALLGCGLAIWLFARNNAVSPFSAMDLCAAAVPIGLLFGRLANFINGELWGRVTNVPWAMVFPEAKLYLPQQRAAAAPSEPALRGRARRLGAVPRPARPHAPFRSARASRPRHRQLPRRLWHLPLVRRVLPPARHAASLDLLLADARHRLLDPDDPARAVVLAPRQAGARRRVTDLTYDPPAYDPGARRDTPLAAKLRDEIRRAGTLSLPQFMSACLADPEHGYYRTRQAIGAQGDFITAPEISQIFGELIGLWSAVTWQQMGSPARFRLIELGPGRGTLMGDALRAARVVPGFLDAAEICLVDINPTLRAAQDAAIATALPGKPPRVTWHDTVTSIYWDNPEALSEPAILIGNEFLDTCPIFQFTRRGDGWVSRRVGLDDDGQLQFAEPRTAQSLGRPRPNSTLDALFPSARDGDVVAKPQFEFLDSDVMPWQRLAALFIDYGHDAPAPGDTLQAVRNHAFEHPLTSPGEADLTAHVDFSAIARRLEGAGSPLAIDGITTQAEFLGSLGIMERASRLMAANPAKAGAIELGVARLMAPQGMGTRFKAIGLRSPDLPPLPGF